LITLIIFLFLLPAGIIATAIRRADIQKPELTGFGYLQMSGRSILAVISPCVARSMFTTDFSPAFLYPVLMCCRYATDVFARFARAARSSGESASQYFLNCFGIFLLFIAVEYT